jgi:hypothetical protein
MVLGLGHLWGGGSEPKLPEGPTRLPDYFPVQPKGCEKVAEDLYRCLAIEATAKARDMEKAGFHRSYFADVTVKPADENAAKVATAAAAAASTLSSTTSSSGQSATATPDSTLPKPGDNPLDECRTKIAHYMKCCDRELKKKKNWILTEPYRVQEEYRYNNNQQATSNDTPKG